MSFFYSFYNCFSPFPQTLYSLCTQPDFQNVQQPLYIIKPQSTPDQVINTENLRISVVPAEPSCGQDSSTPKIPANSREKKQSKRHISPKKDEAFGRRKQNKDRNMMSYIFKGYVQYVFHQRGMVKVIEQYSKKSSLDNGVTRFYEFMMQKFPTNKSYIGIRYILGLLSQASSQPAMAHILCLTLRLYLKQVYPMLIIQGPQSSKRQRLSLLRKARAIVSILFKK